MADYAEARAVHEVSLEPPAPSTCHFVSVDPAAAKSFVDYNLEHDFGERRMALLFGRFVSPSVGSGQKRGVLVDAVYEPAQASSDHGFGLDGSSDGAAERERAERVARSLGLTCPDFDRTSPHHATLLPWLAPPVDHHATLLCWRG